jgi:uncharacterized protein YpmB
MKQQTNNKWKWIAIVLFTIFLLAGAFSACYVIVKDKYDSGISDGVNQTIQEIALSQVQTGNILITNGTAITTIPISNICRGLGYFQRASDSEIIQEVKK